MPNDIKKQNASTPALRFEGYEQPWHYVALNELADKVQEKNRDAQYNEVLTNAAEYGILRQRDYFDHDIANQAHIQGYYVVRENHFVYNPRISAAAPVGPINRNTLGQTGVMSPLYSVFKTHDVEESFLEYYFKSAHWHDYMRQNADSGARSDRFAIKDEAFFAMPVPLTADAAEQKQIAGLFSSLDNAIRQEEAENRRLKQLEDIFMQKLFPPCGACVPALRFDGFQTDWSTCQLGVIGTPYTGLSGKTKADFGHGAARFVTYVNVFENPLTSPTATEAIEIDPRQNAVRRGDIFFTISSETPQEVGMASVCDFDAPHVYLNSFCVGFRPHIELDAAFLAYLLRSPCFREQVVVLAQGISRYNISKQKLMTLTVPIPAIEEQKAIGRCFRELAQLRSLKHEREHAVKQMKQTLLTKLYV